MNKEFKLIDNQLIVTVTAEDEIFLPNENGRETIGRFTQKTVQTITSDKIQFLKDFINKEYNKGTEQLELINKQLSDLTDINDIDTKLVQELQSRIGKGSKVFKQKMLVLNDHITKVNKKRQLTQQKEFIGKEVNRLSKEIGDMNKALE